MKVKLAIFAVLVAFLVLSIRPGYPGSVEVNTRDIDIVRGKAVLGDEDLRIIDDFLADAIRQLVGTRDFTSIARIRTVILSRQSSQGQYAQKFVESARRHIASGFQQAQEIRRPERRTQVIINLLILMDGLQDLGLTDLAIGMLRNENVVVRYWAVHCLTNPGIVGKLNTAANSNRVSVIATRLQGVIETGTPEILAMIAKFAVDIKIPKGEELLVRIADERIKRYADWTVKNELSDIAILKYLESKIPLSPGGLGVLVSSSTKPEIAKRFSQLFSYIVQRYIKGRNSLNEVQKRHLVSVIIEVENKCISRLLGTPQSVMRKAIEQNDMSSILTEHDRLFGNTTTPGQLPTKLGFDYNTTSTGVKRVAPLSLPDPPEKKS